MKFKQLTDKLDRLGAIPNDLVMVQRDDGSLLALTDVKYETHDNGMVSTIWLKVEDY